MSNISKSFFYAANAANAVGSGIKALGSVVSDIASGDWITKATYGFDESRVDYDEKNDQLLDKQGNIVADYNMQDKTLFASTTVGIAMGFIGCIMASLNPVSALVPLAVLGGLAVGVPVASMNVHALGSAARYGLTNLYNRGSQAVAEEAAMAPTSGQHMSPLASLPPSSPAPG
jgi:hypothetical protein